MSQVSKPKPILTPIYSTTLKLAPSRGVSFTPASTTSQLNKFNFVFNNLITSFYFSSGNYFFAPPDQGMRRPEFLRLSLSFSRIFLLSKIIQIPRIGFRPFPDKSSYEDILSNIRFSIRCFQNDNNGRARLGRAIFDKPRQPKPFWSFCKNNLVARSGGDADRLADRTVKDHLLDDVLSAT